MRIFFSIQIRVLLVLVYALLWVVALLAVGLFRPRLAFVGLVGVCWGFVQEPLATEIRRKASYYTDSDETRELALAYLTVADSIEQADDFLDPGNLSNL